MFLLTTLAILPATVCQTAAADTPDNQRFERLAERYLDEFVALDPVGATTLGDHRYDSQLNQVSPAQRDRTAAFCRTYLKELATIKADRLSRANQVDRAMLEQSLLAQLWRLEALQQWAWNPLNYTGLAGGSIYGLMARQFAPLDERLMSVADRLQQFPRLFEQIRATLQLDRVPKIHAETAVKQNRGVLSILDNMVVPHLDVLSPADRQRLEQAMAAARATVEEHQAWLETELLPKATADFRLGGELFEAKLAHTLQTPLKRGEIRRRAEAQLGRVREEMYVLSKGVYLQQYPSTAFPADPTEAYKQAVIRAALELAYADIPDRDRIVEEAKLSLEKTTAFVRRKDLVTIPPDPVEIIVMPEFQRGVSIAYCDSPGALDVGQGTFYAVAPLPREWTEQQVLSFLREYNDRSLHNLTIHEAMPGHFVQLAHANRYPGKLRAVLSSGVFIEGWAVYTEWMMCDEGFLDNDPLMRLIVLKWLLRVTTNALMDQAIHADGMTREEAMRLMVEDGFQEEREAAAKWVRAQLTSAQLSTYFVGRMQMMDLRREAEQRWGERFDLKTYHDRVISFGSPSVRFVRALLFDEEIPR